MTDHPLANGYRLSEGLSEVDFPRTTSFLASTYWSPGITQDKVERAARGSAVVVSVHHDTDGQIGYARLVSDGVTFGWVCDVFVAEGHRGKGLARSMVRYFLNHPDHKDLRRFVLGTRDAHGVYAAVGFVPFPETSRWMTFRPHEQPPPPDGR